MSAVALTLPLQRGPPPNPTTDPVTLAYYRKFLALGNEPEEAARDALDARLLDCNGDTPAELHPPLEPTPHAAGSPGRIEKYRERFLSFQTLYHHADGREDAPDNVLQLPDEIGPLVHRGRNGQPKRGRLRLMSWRPPPPLPPVEDLA